MHCFSFFFLNSRLLAKFSPVFILFLIVISGIQLALSSSPTWLKEGVYVEYEFKSGDIRFLNGTWISDKFQAAFRWECINIKGDIATLNVSVIFNGEMQTIQLSTIVYVDRQNRNVTLLNGTDIGKTLLWTPINITAKIEAGWAATCQGAQKFFWTDGRGYESDTGILIYLILSGEPALLALGVKDLDFVRVAPSITATNIDLGPREWLPEIILSLPYILPVIAFFIIFIVLLRRRVQRKKRKLACRQNNTPTKCK